jgi:DNA polymerase III epsilon subunit-like protein
MKFSSDIVVNDLEATCEVFNCNEIEETNIIEVDDVKLDRHGLKAISEFSILISPGENPLLPEISEKTGITPSMVEKQPYFKDAVKSFIKWYGERNKSILAVWGLYYDF